MTALAIGLLPAGLPVKGSVRIEISSAGMSSSQWRSMRVEDSDGVQSP